MHFFSADPRQPKLDWLRLHQQLVDAGFIVDLRSGDFERDMLGRLWKRIVKANALPDLGDQGEPRRLSELADRSIRAGLPLEPLALDYETLSVSQFATALIEHGLLPAKCDYMSEREYQPGPLYHEMCDVPNARYGWNSTYLYFQDFGERIVVKIGEIEPPGIPGTDRVVEDWVQFLESWLEDPSRKWIDPETGASFGLLELDWEDLLGAGKGFVSVSEPGYLNGPKVAAFLGELTGQPFRFSRMHI